MNEISELANISPLADIEVSSRGSKLIVGDHSMIDAFVKIKFCGGLGDIQIGQYCSINSGNVLYSGNGIRIGNNVLVAANCTFAPTNHEYRDRTKAIKDQGFMPSKGGIIVEDDVWIGANVTLVDGSIVKKGCVIGAGSLVRGETVPYGIYAGTPARLIGMRE